MAGEEKLQTKIIKFLTPMRDVYFTNNWGSGVGEGGISDLTLCVHGKYVAFELKNPNHTYKAGLRQKIHAKKVQRAGGQAYFIESFQEFLEIFNSL